MQSGCARKLGCKRLSVRVRNVFSSVVASTMVLLLGGVRVLGGDLQVTLTPVAFGSHFNLSALGQSDWAHWGRAGVWGNYDHKATGGSQISGVTVIQSVAGDSGKASASASYQARLASWTNGTPTASVANDYGFVYAEATSSRQGMGYSFTAKADTTLRTLYVLTGGYGATPKFQVSLSDNSAPAITNITAPGVTTNFQRIYAVTYRANSPNQTLNVSFTRSAGSYSVDLKAAWLVVGGPPSVVLTTPANGDKLLINNSGPSHIEIAANAVDEGGTVANVNFYVDGVLAGADSVSPYSIIWTNATAGNHTLTAIATDNEGQSGPATPVAVAVVVNPLTAPKLALSAITPVTNGSRFHLTALGTSDWAHWGAGGTWGSYIHKASGGGQISDVTEIETVASDSGLGFADSVNKVRLASWTDGTPVANATNQTGFIYAEAPSSRQGMGYSFTVPADTTLRTLSILAGGFGTTPKLELALSDSSAPDVVDLTPPGTTGQYQRIYTIQYRAATAGQHLTVKLTRAVGTYSVDLKAAWLVLGGQSNLALAYLYGSASNTLTLRWSNPKAELFTTTNLVPPVSWSAWNGLTTTNATNFYASISTTGGSRFFRLVEFEGRTGVKWHPGHYVNGYWGTDVDGTIAQAKKSSAVKGVSFLHGWWTLETAPGVFDFSTIDTQLAKAKAAGLQLIIQIVDRTFFASRPHAVPTYMLTDPIYQGGESILTDGSGGFRKATALRFVPAVQDRMNALYVELGARYDLDPNFEAVGLNEEDSFETTGSNMSGYSSRAYIDQEKRGMTAGAAAFPHTVTLKWLNWGPGNSELFAHAASLGVGVCGPDLDPNMTTFSYPVNYQAYFGQVPLAMAVQWPRVETTVQNGSPPLTIATFGISAPPAGIGLNYIIWDPAYSAVINYDTDILPAINATPLTQTACPTSFTNLRGGCDGD